MMIFENDDHNWYRIPSLVTTPKGTLIATCDQRKGSYQDHGQDTDVVMRRSTDGGKTWTPKVTLATKHNATLHSGASLVDKRTDRVFKFFRVAPRVSDHRRLFDEERNNWSYWRDWGAGNFMIHSDDEGETWSMPRRLDFEHPDATMPPRLANSVHGIQLGDGTLVVPACCSCADSFEYDADMPSRSFLLLSEDGGDTWYAGATWAPGYAQMEFTIAEMRDGRVYVNQRSLGPYRRVLWVDDVRSTPVLSLRPEPQLPEPVCHAGLQRIDDQVFFVNPSVENRNRRYREDMRRNLTLQVSNDDGKTWTAIRQLREGPAGYADLASLPGGALACLYECGEVRYNDRIDFLLLEGLTAVPEQAE
jgi:sialidase-1